MGCAACASSRPPAWKGIYILCIWDGRGGAPSPDRIISRHRKYDERGIMVLRGDI